ncbi:hypothetical protein RTP6_004182 [Batrachochytrium dendrobatidis]
MKVKKNNKSLITSDASNTHDVSKILSIEKISIDHEDMFAFDHDDEAFTLSTKCASKSDSDSQSCLENESSFSQQLQPDLEHSFENPNAQTGTISSTCNMPQVQVLPSSPASSPTYLMSQLSSQLSLSRTISNDTNHSDTTIKPSYRNNFRSSFDNSRDKVVDIHNFAASDAEDDTEEDNDINSHVSGNISHYGSVSSSTNDMPRPTRRHITLHDFTLLRVIGRGAYGKVFLVKRKDHLADSMHRLPNTSTCSVSNNPTIKDSHSTSDLLSPHGISIKQDDSTSSRHNSALTSVSPSSYQRASYLPKSNNLFAMKVLRKASIVLHGKETEHTQNERSILEAVRHPFIVKLLYAFQTPEKLYLILSYASGGELFTYLAHERMFSENVACFYISELLLAIEHLHSLGIIYRDLKPENVLLDSEGHVILTDFGLSKVAVGASTICGTVEFMAPEVIEERLEYGNGVDYWSLGVMLYDMLTGSPPFCGGNRKKIMEAILKKKPTFPKYMTADSRDLCTKLLKKNPDQRLGTGEDGAMKVKKHNFFRKTEWKRLLAREVTPPFIPKLVCID